MAIVEYLRAASACFESVESAGLEVEEFVDFDLVEQLIDEMDKPYLTPVLAPSNHDFTQENAFWLVAWDGEEPAMIIGARLEAIGEEPVDRYWKRTSRRHYPSGSEETIENVAPQIVKELQGRLAYIGDLFVRKGSRGNRVLLETFMLLVHMVVGLKWDPDFTYAFMRDRDVQLGFANRYKFTRHIPRARSWVNPPVGRADNEWLVSLSRSDRKHIMKDALELANRLRVVEDEPVPRKVANR